MSIAQFHAAMSSFQAIRPIQATAELRRLGVNRSILMNWVLWDNE